MARRKRQPYDPAKIHDRRATEINIGISGNIAVIEVDDPFEQGAKIAAIRSTRDDPLAWLHSRSHIDEAQYMGGRAFQRDFEAAERGAKAVDFTLEAVDGGLMPEPITERQRRAARQLARVYRTLGQDGSALTHAVLIHSQTYATIAHSRGLDGKRWEEYIGLRFRECLDCLAKVYNFAT